MGSEMCIRDSMIQGNVAPLQRALEASQRYFHRRAVWSVQPRVHLLQPGWIYQFVRTQYTGDIISSPPVRRDDVDIHDCEYAIIVILGEVSPDSMYPLLAECWLRTVEAGINMQLMKELNRRWAQSMRQKLGLRLAR